MGKLKAAMELVKFYTSFLNSDLFKIYLNQSRNSSGSHIEHLDAAAQWICRAQDATDDGGVARSYSLVYHPYFKKKGWFPSYPETTGYIIPTIFDYAHLVNSQEMFDRAVRMADWEVKVQMENGAVQGGTVDQMPTPAVFNTGQVIFGWLRAYEETKNGIYLECALKAGRFLLENQDPDGAWRKHLSNYASGKMPFYTYNTRTAWALFLLSLRADRVLLREASIRNIEFSLRQQADNGWFQANCLNDSSQPLLHTIAYCVRGILEIGALSGEKRYLRQAQKAADSLLKRQRADGSLAGRFNSEWEPTVNWSCLTGDAQISIIWSRIYQFTGDPKYINGAKRINGYLKKRQLISPGKNDIHGGICGSYPIHGNYGKFEVFNWAVKFFMDALMIEKK